MDIESAGNSHQRYNCVCSTYNFGRPHVVSSTTWYRHFQEASADEQQRMQDAKFDNVAPPSNHRARGTASRRRNSILPTQKRARELGEAQAPPPPDKRGRQGEPEVCFHVSILALCTLTCS